MSRRFISIVVGGISRGIPEMRMVAVQRTSCGWICCCGLVYWSIPGDSISMYEALSVTDVAFEVVVVVVVVEIVSSLVFFGEELIVERVLCCRGGRGVEKSDA